MDQERRVVTAISITQMSVGFVTCYLVFTADYWIEAITRSHRQITFFFA